MEIEPGVGVPLVRLGESREVVVACLGEPRVVVGQTHHFESPALLIDFDDGGLVELIQVPYSGVGDEVTLLGVQLTYRLMSDVLADLRERGYTGTPSDIGYDFHAGFAVFSMASVSPHEVDATIPEDDESEVVVEGVAVAAYDYFASSP